MREQLKLKVVLGVGLWSALAFFGGAGCEDGEIGVSEDMVLTTKSSLSTVCSISVGGGGETETINLYENEPSVLLRNTSANWDFIRETTGPCHFVVYNHAEGEGKYVNLGTNLDVRIRAGEDGVRYKDDGGGDTWKIRSVKIVKFFNNLDCILSIGGGGVRMNYYPGSYPKTPAMDRLSYLVGGNCDAKIWNGIAYGANDSDNRFKALHSNARTVEEGRTRSVYDPGFRVRSLIITHWGNQHCNSSSPNYDFGRCLPITTLERSIYDTTHANYRDLDGDGLDDEMEDMLANAFRPIVVNHSTEDATRTNVYTTVDGDSVIEPVTAFQVRRSKYDSNAITLAFMKIWREDKGVLGCSGHDGDTQSTTLQLMTTNDSNHGKTWWLYSTSASPDSIKTNTEETLNSELSTTLEYSNDNHVSESIIEQETRERRELAEQNLVYDFYDNSDLELSESVRGVELSAAEKDADITQLSQSRAGAGSEFSWTQGSVAIRAPYFEKLANSNETIPMHPVIHLTKGKHHEYQDGGWAGQRDLVCTLTNAWINSRGEQANPPLPKRALNLRSPNGHGDAFNYNNVGSRDHYTGFMNSLTPFGFSGKMIWKDECFYSSDCNAPNRVFYCSNNLNKSCCLEAIPGCSIQSNWECH